MKTLKMAYKEELKNMKNQEKMQINENKKKTNEIKIKQKKYEKNHSLQYRTIYEKQKQEALQIKRELKSMKGQLEQIKKG